MSKIERIVPWILNSRFLEAYLHPKIVKMASDVVDDVVSYVYARMLVSFFRGDMWFAIARTVADRKERGFYIYLDENIDGRTRLQVGTESEIELNLKELPLSLNITDFTLISFHTHNGENDKPSIKDVTTALALGEDYTCIGYVKNNRPRIACWKITLPSKKVFEE